MNLSITGKKYIVPTSAPKIPDSLIIQTKPTTVKFTQPKPNIVKEKRPV